MTHGCSKGGQEPLFSAFHAAPCLAWQCVLRRSVGQWGAAVVAQGNRAVAGHANLPG